MRKLITCPETVHLEVIELESTELGRDGHELFGSVHASMFPAGRSLSSYGLPEGSTVEIRRDGASCGLNMPVDSCRRAMVQPTTKLAMSECAPQTSSRAGSWFRISLAYVQRTRGKVRFT